VVHHLHLHYCRTCYLLYLCPTTYVWCCKQNKIR
jgi:hypothetical protein